MPVSDPSSGRLFIWLISCFLFISVLTGGTFLILYLVLPQSSATAWLPFAGVSLVSLPWLFWCFTCLYRIISRALGFRFIIGGGGGGGNGGLSHPNAASNEPRNLETPLESTGGDGKRVQFGGAVVVGAEDDDDDDNEKITNVKRSSSSLSSNDLSIATQESEMPLTSAMA
ncbi:hypothetical protein JCGZ_15350 [Jatropha curcas]|uniref:Uncharacterized protein n=1 Tax=Jatropha curcas TaxID=180498 RepID=A0A067KGS7_JATCU|nr:uncharacterized protein LOC105640188 [Jatropha curcas]KDP31470.1 hypothetical protein JCGZ_15350 [Jatropha curcas]